jgi:hypothetical protein
MEKKEKSAEDKSLLKMKQMNNNMFSFIKSIPGMIPEMDLKNQLDPKNPDKFIPQYDIVGQTPSFKFKIIINPEEDFQVKIILENDITFNLDNNSQLRFVLENYLPQPKIEKVKK